jgi:phenylalanine ammonia-lyase
MQADFKVSLAEIVTEELHNQLSTQATSLRASLLNKMMHTFDETSTMDAAPRMVKIVDSCNTIFLDAFTSSGLDVTALAALPAFRTTVASRATDALITLRRSYLGGERGPAPASKLLNRTRAMYEFVRLTLDIRMHGSENEHLFEHGLGVEDVTIGQNVSLIYEAIRDGKLQGVVVDMLA